MTEDLQAIVVRAQRGDAAACEQIAEVYRPQIRRYLATMVGDANTADDLTQDTLRRVFAKLSTLKHPERVQSWIFAIAVNACRDHLRRQVNAPVAQGQEPEAVRRSALSSIIRRESAELLAVALDRLPILLREAFVLHEVEGLPYGEIAEITGASVEALQVRKHRAKALLRRQLGPVVDTFWSERG